MPAKKTPAASAKAPAKAVTPPPARPSSARAPAAKGKQPASAAKATGKGAIVPKSAGKQTPATSGGSTPAMKVLAERNRERHTPPVFKVPSKKAVPIVFSLEDVREVIKAKKSTPAPFSPPLPAAPAAAKPKVVVDPSAPREIRKVGAASLADLLGGRALARKPIGPYDEAAVPPKWKRYFKLLIGLRKHVIEGLEMHTQDSLMRSARDDSGDLSGYGQHMADAGTETFDRDFALSLVSSEQEALAEIEAALGRIFSGSYGVCEITGQPISPERLEAVPFTRYSVAGQAEYERQHRRHVQRGGLFLDASVEDAANFSEDDDGE